MECRSVLSCNSRLSLENNSINRSLTLVVKSFPKEMNSFRYLLYNTRGDTAMGWKYPCSAKTTRSTTYSPIAVQQRGGRLSVSNTPNGMLYMLKSQSSGISIQEVFIFFITYP